MHGGWWRAIKNFLCSQNLKWSCVFESIAWWNNCSLTRISFSHIYCTPDLYPFKDLISISYFMFARAYFLGNEIYTKNAKFFFIDLAKLSINNDNVIPILFSSCHHIIIVMSTIAPINISKLPYVCICSRVIAISLYRYCALYWPIVILVNPLYFLFLWPDFVIALYIVVLFRMQKPLERISRIVDAVKKLSSNQFPRLFQALNSCFLGDRHPHNIRSVHQKRLTL